MEKICGNNSSKTNRVGIRLTKKKGLITTPGNTYNGGICICGHSAMAHHITGHFMGIGWQCWKGKWVEPIKNPPQFILTALPCEYHKFKQDKSRI